MMRLLPDKNFYKTITFKLTLGSQLIIIPHKKISESKKDTITLYMNEIDSELKMWIITS